MIDEEIQLKTVVEATLNSVAASETDHPRATIEKITFHLKSIR